MSDLYPHDKDVALKVAISASISLATMMVDFGLLIRDEVEYVWSRLCTSWPARLYILGRYFGMASQIYSVYFTVRMYLGVDTSPHGCRLWFTYQAVVIQVLLLLVESLLMLRIYALFLRNRLILVTLVSFGLCQVASLWVSARLSHPSSKHTATCLIVKANPRNALFSATTLTTSAVILFMTYFRYLRLPVIWTRHGIGRVVFRDSALSLSAIAIIMLFLMLSSLEVIKPIMSGNITYYWLVCILWVSLGRIIVNHEKIPRDEDEQGEGSTWRGTLQLTSQIEMGESTLPSDTQCTSTDEQTRTSGTLQTSLSIPATKASQLSPSTPSSDSSRQWFGDCPFGPYHGQERRHSPRPSGTELSTSARRLSRSSVCTNDGGVSPTEDCPHPDAVAGRRVGSPSQPSSSSKPPSPKA